MMKQTKLIFVARAVIGAFFVFLVVSNGREIETTRGIVSRSLEEIPQPVLDYQRPICSGPRRGTNEDKERKPYYKKAIYGLHLGRNSQYGALNNKIIELFNAVDNAIDSGGNTVVVVSGWALKWMMDFFPDEDSWEQLGRDFPIVRDSSDLILLPLVVTTRDLLERSPRRNLKATSSWEEVQARRLKFLHYLFSSLEGTPCDYMNEVQAFLQDKFGQSKYIAVHVRGLDGMCESFNQGNPFAHEQCEMSPSYIENILESSGVASGELPIVLLSDMQDKVKLHKLQDELDHVVVPQFDFDAQPSMIADLVIGAMSEVFIGERSSSGSRNIALLREALGRDTSTNYVHMDKTKEGKWTSLSPHYPYEWRPSNLQQ